MSDWFRETPESLHLLAQERAAMTVSDIMHKHRPRRLRRGLRGGDYEQCQAGCKYEPGSCYEHIAGAVVEELQMIEERRTNVMSSSGQTTDTNTVVTTSHSDIRYDRRLVSEWRPEGKSASEGLA